MTDTPVSTSDKYSLTIPADTVTCDAVSEYLDTSNADIDTDATVASGNKIVVDYVGRLIDGTVFDTSVESVARGCDKYTPGRDYTSGLPFTVGAGQMIAGFDAAVVGMNVGETRSILIPAKHAYGEEAPEVVSQTVPKDQLPAMPEGTNYEVGQELRDMYGTTWTVTAIADTEVTLEGAVGHELGGQDLIFDITIKSVE